MGLLQGFADMGSPAQTPAQAARALETLVLKQVLAASGAFGGSGAAGASLHSDLFVEALAEAVSKSGGLGLAAQLESALRGTAPGPRPVASGPVAAPISGPAHITSPFGPRVDPFTGEVKEHHGVDVAAALGSPILAAAAGTVRQAGERGGYGACVEVEHGDGTTTLYAHASELLVREGDRVEAGQAIAKAGHSGRATGNHLHFELRVRGQPVDPTRALKVYGRRDEEGFEGVP